MSTTVIETRDITDADDLYQLLNELLVRRSIAGNVGVVYLDFDGSDEFTAHVDETILSDGSKAYSLRLCANDGGGQ